MPIQDSYGRTPVGSISVNREGRQRQASLDTSDLEASIAKRGLLTPIILSQDEPLPDGFQFKLIAGERRLLASQRLGLPDIAYRLITDLSPIEAQIVELEENLKRLDLEWPDLVRATGRIHGLYRQLDPDWTMGETAEALGLTLGTVSMYLRVHAELGASAPGSPDSETGNVKPNGNGLAQAGTVREAYNQIARKDQRAMGQALEELLAPAQPPDGAKPNGHLPGSPDNVVVLAAPPPDPILGQSFLDWAPQYTGKKFNLVHCDFPYGVDVFGGPQGRGAESARENGQNAGQVGYEDTPDTYWQLLDCLCTNLDRFMSVSGHLVFWLSADDSTVARTREIFAKLAPSLEFYKFRLVWVKSDGMGIASIPSLFPRHVYETALLATRGKRNSLRVVADAYQAPTNKDLHPSTKPEPMLRHFFQALVDENSSVLDPTCGSGAALRAAESLGASRVLGLEIDQGFADGARRALRTARALRVASRTSQPPAEDGL